MKFGNFQGPLDYYNFAVLALFIFGWFKQTFCIVFFMNSTKYVLFSGICGNGVVGHDYVIITALCVLRVTFTACGLMLEKKPGHRYCTAIMMLIGELPEPDHQN